MIIRQAPVEHYRWLVERVGWAPTGAMRAIEAIDESGEIAGMVAFDNWMFNSAEIHFAVDKPIAFRKLMFAAFDWIFNQSERDYIIALTPAKMRADVLDIGRRVGFKEIHRLKDGFAKGEDLVYSVLHKDACKYLKRK